MYILHLSVYLFMCLPMPAVVSPLVMPPCLQHMTPFNSIIYIYMYTYTYIFYYIYMSVLPVSMYMSHVYA